MTFHSVPTDPKKKEHISNVGFLILSLVLFFHYKRASTIFNGFHERILGQLPYLILLFKA